MSEAYNPQQSKDLQYVYALQDIEIGKRMGMFILHAAPGCRTYGTFVLIKGLFRVSDFKIILEPCTFFSTVA
jgi:hypothetical protein